MRSQQKCQNNSDSVSGAFLRWQDGKGGVGRQEDQGGVMEDEVYAKAEAAEH